MTFEDEELASLGCEVHGYDPTLDNPPKLHNPEKVHFHTEGLSFHTGPHLLIDSGTGNEVLLPAAWRHGLPERRMVGEEEVWTF